MLTFCPAAIVAGLLPAFTLSSPVKLMETLPDALTIAGAVVPLTLSAPPPITTFPAVAWSDTEFTLIVLPVSVIVLAVTSSDTSSV
jgi:hypothetical protein